MAESLFVIDSTFLLETSRNTFRGAPLLQDSSGRDTTMLFGFARDLLRMRQRVGMRRALIVIGDEPCLPDSLISDAIGFLKQLRVPVLYAKGDLAIDSHNLARLNGLNVLEAYRRKWQQVF